jgi:1,6-anhydro-N-acetylmuramate kinase
MMTKEHLTSEYLKQVAPSAFEIAHLAIEVTKAYIRKGHQIEVEDVLEMLRHRTAQEIIADIDESEGPIS